MSQIPSPVPSAETSPVSMKRVAAASTIGSVIEFYDFIIYGTAAALVFPAVFFPALGTGAGTVAAFATFAVAFVARPLGALIFGHYGDRLGRKKTLILTLLIMGGATFLVGVLPDASLIGVAAPLILVTLRFLQGLAVGGEWAGATLMATEHAPAHRRGLWASFPQLGPSLGFVLASATFLVINLTLGDTSEAFVGFAWRIPFILSAALVVVGLYIRLKVEETPVFRREQERSAAASPVATVPRTLPVWESIRIQPVEILLGGGAAAMLFAFFYISTAFLTSYGTTVLGHSRPAVLTAGIIAALVFAGGTVLAGVLSDRFGRRPVVLTSVIVALPWSLLLFPLLDSGSYGAFVLGLSVTMFIVGGSYGPFGSYLPELFQTRYRYTGAGTAYNLAALVGGGVTPLVAAALAASFGGMAIGYLLAGVSALSIVCALALRETGGTSLDTEHATTGSADPAVDDTPAAATL
ncbi:MAG: MHS family MFS transporter [Microbacterium sp.]|uniref:MFS transporter n=1 Tax=Microbacterium sp. TaxID=51671 RepID=UPI001AC35551|nr:MFS transporter [Microbacterium sp.]MBN9176902.1 MHS family MFS transporter [Microbacterium sp.]